MDQQVKYNEQGEIVVSPLKYCFKKKITILEFKEWCQMFDVQDEDEDTNLQLKQEAILDFRRRGYNVALLMCTYRVSPFRV